MSESVETMVLILGGDVLGRHRIGDMESRVLRYLMQQEVSYRLLQVIQGPEYKGYYSQIPGCEKDWAKQLDSIYFEIPLDDLADELDIDAESIVKELRAVFKHLTQNVFIQNKRGVYEDSQRGVILGKGKDEGKVEYFAQVDDNWCYEPLFTRVEINKKALIIDMKGTVLNLLLAADMDQFSDSRFKSIYSRLVSKAIAHHLEVDPKAKDDLVGGLNNFRLRIDMGELRRWTCTTEKYVRYSQFKERVLDVAVREITAYGDYTLDYEVIKEGKKVTGVEFIGSIKEDAKKGFREGLLLLNGTQSDMYVIKAMLAQRGIKCTPEEAYEVHQLFGKESVRYFLEDLDFVTSRLEEQEVMLLDINPWSDEDIYIRHADGEVFKNLIICGEGDVQRGSDGRIVNPLQYLKKIQENRNKKKTQKTKEEIKAEMKAEWLEELKQRDASPVVNFKPQKGYYDQDDVYADEDQGSW